MSHGNGGVVRYLIQWTGPEGRIDEPFELQVNSFGHLLELLADTPHPAEATSVDILLIREHSGCRR
jgi:hypothetical protein